MSFIIPIVFAVFWIGAIIGSIPYIIDQTKNKFLYPMIWSFFLLFGTAAILVIKAYLKIRREEIIETREIDKEQKFNILEE